MAASRRPPTHSNPPAKSDKSAEYCTKCNKSGHSNTGCFDLHPELIAQYRAKHPLRERGKGKKGKKAEAHAVMPGDEELNIADLFCVTDATEPVASRYEYTFGTYQVFEGVDMCCVTDINEISTAVSVSCTTVFSANMVNPAPVMEMLHDMEGMPIHESASVCPDWSAQTRHTGTYDKDEFKGTDDVPVPELQGAKDISTYDPVSMLKDTGYQSDVHTSVPTFQGTADIPTYDHESMLKGTGRSSCPTYFNPHNYPGSFDRVADSVSSFPNDAVEQSVYFSYQQQQSEFFEPLLIYRERDLRKTDIRVESVPTVECFVVTYVDPAVEANVQELPRPASAAVLIPDQGYKEPSSVVIVCGSEAEASLAAPVYDVSRYELTSSAVTARFTAGNTAVAMDSGAARSLCRNIQLMQDVVTCSTNQSSIWYRRVSHWCGCHDPVCSSNAGQHRRVQHYYFKISQHVVYSNLASQSGCCRHHHVQQQK